MPSSADFPKSAPYFSALSDKEFEQVKKEAVEEFFAKGAILFLEGESCRGLYLVKSGRIRVFKSSSEGREQVLFIAGPGDSFNDVPVFDGGPNPASASALEPSTVYLIPKAALLSLIAECPPAQAIIELFASRLRHLTRVVEDLSFRSVFKRMARLLLDLAVIEGGTKPIPRLTQDEMAARVGSVRDVIGRVLKTLEKTGSIKMEGQRIYVIDPKKLKEMT